MLFSKHNMRSENINWASPKIRLFRNSNFTENNDKFVNVKIHMRDATKDFVIFNIPLPMAWFHVTVLYTAGLE